MEQVLRDETSARAFVEGLTDAAGMLRLEALSAALINENQRQNLISRPSEAQMWVRHIADSAQLLRLVPRETPSRPWLDLGTGAGFPGLVIAALRPEWKIVLVESRARRVEWLEHMVRELDLGNCRVEGRRLELVEPFKASVISARAFAPLEKLLSLSAPFSTKATTYLLPKGRSAAQELQAMPRKIRGMFHVEQSLTDEEAGIIVSK
ncbi:16S rRNA (guanine(527)-N(7))-methyltransferase RsmG [Altererythrobacter rubellus]|jgi:16S rRNA (guanine527-N7)-methyltransferase|uniref:Ribosomal RNA small subunit methyltransferase G n=1 Tax=Altererythrobacter rubellus TaxID=2173831 RepID=A0A9Y2B8P2_9SPHN|nr:16S rRNA (guanine(527)-N(7))-methyltransferase RsmG [Altererythrobacter rubellus]WIW95879.1 16S rRNA (guanine(527)-N(7))-methyltransferase RsmG [Altererythrobacter rubellus]